MEAGKEGLAVPDYRPLGTSKLTAHLSEPAVVTVDARYTGICPQ